MLARLAEHGADIDSLARCDEVRRPIEDQREAHALGGRHSRLLRLMREMPELAADLDVPARGSAHAPTRQFHLSFRDAPKARDPKSIIQTGAIDSGFAAPDLGLPEIGILELPKRLKPTWVATRNDSKSHRRLHVAPDILTFAAPNRPPASQAKMMIGVPASSSLLLPGATAAITVSLPTTTFFSPSLYFTVSVSPSLAGTMLST